MTVAGVLDESSLLQGPSASLDLGQRNPESPSASVVPSPPIFSTPAAQDGFQECSFSAWFRKTTPLVERSAKKALHGQETRSDAAVEKDNVVGAAQFEQWLAATEDSTWTDPLLQNPTSAPRAPANTLLCSPIALMPQSDGQLERGGHMQGSPAGYLLASPMQVSSDHTLSNEPSFHTPLAKPTYDQEHQRLGDTHAPMAVTPAEKVLLHMAGLEPEVTVFSHLSCTPGLSSPRHVGQAPSSVVDQVLGLMSIHKPSRPHSCSEADDSGADSGDAEVHGEERWDFNSPETDSDDEIDPEVLGYFSCRDAGQQPQTPIHDIIDMMLTPVRQPAHMSLISPTSLCDEMDLCR